MTTKVKVRNGKYMIYRMYCKDLDAEETLFFLPDSDLQHLVDRISTITAYKASGYVVMGVLYVGHETYLNARLMEYCKEFIELDELEQEEREKLRNGDLSEEVAVETLGQYKELKMTALKKVNMCMRRMMYKDYDIENELACQLNDLYYRELNL